MLVPFLLALVAIGGGALATYLYDEDAPLAARLCMGAVTAFAALGLAGFLLSSLVGLTPVSLILSALVVASPFVMLRRAGFRARVRADWEGMRQGIRRAISRPTWRTTALILFYAGAAVALWLLFDRVLIERAGGLFTGVTNNYGDLPFHLGIITSFVHGQNFPPQDPEYAGVKFTYPFIADFVAAMFVRAGASLRDALFLENFVLGLSLVGLLHRWALLQTRDRAAALLTPLLVLLSGGLGWWMLLDEARASERGLFALLAELKHDYTIMHQGGWRWGNALTALLVPQRSILLGLPLAIIVFTQWWLAQEAEGEEGKSVNGEKVKSGKRRAKDVTSEAVPSPSSAVPLFPFSPAAKRMIAAGLIAGSLVLVHAHSFGVVMLAGACLALIFRARWREWALFFAAAFIVAAPQVLWSTVGSSTSFRSFLGWQFGWDKGEENFVWFWFKNTGFFIPLIVAALLWRRERTYLIGRRLLLFYLPFVLFFLIPNLIRLAPWVWDNNKVIFYWWVASCPLVALLLVELWRMNRWGSAAALLLFVSLTLAGALDVWRVVSQTTEHGEFDAQGLAFAEMVKERTPPRALIVNAPTFNHPVLLTGRRSLLGYPGHIWTHGLEYKPREDDIKRIYAGGTDAPDLLRKYGVEYVVTGPLERNLMPVNEQFFTQYTKVGEVGGYSLYKITRPQP